MSRRRAEGKRGGKRTEHGDERGVEVEIDPVA